MPVTTILFFGSVSAAVAALTVIPAARPFHLSHCFDFHVSQNTPECDFIFSKNFQNIENMKCLRQLQDYYSTLLDTRNEIHVQSMQENNLLQDVGRCLAYKSGLKQKTLTETGL